VVVLAAAKVGGILANSTFPVEILNDNLRIQTNVFEAAHAAGVERLLFLGSSCIYPKLAPQPIPESSLLTGPLEPTNDAYAIAKIAGIIAIKSYRAQYGRRWIFAGWPLSRRRNDSSRAPAGHRVHARDRPGHRLDHR
jgi:GDP-L-fucose synthase